MLKFENPEPKTEEVTHIVELETWWTLLIDNGKEEAEVDVTICYERIADKLYFAKVKMDLEEWTITATSNPDEFELRVWIHRELEKIFEDENVYTIGKIVGQIMDMLMGFVNDNDIQGVF